MEEMGSSDNWFCRCGVSQGYGHPSFSSRNRSEAGAAVLEGTALALVAVVLPFPRVTELTSPPSLFRLEITAQCGFILPLLSTAW